MRFYIDDTIRKSDGRLSIVTIALSLTIRPKSPLNVSDAHINKVSHFGTKFGEEGVGRCKPNFNRSGRDMGLSYTKEIVSISFAVWAQCTNVTNRQTEHGTITSIPVADSACQWCQPSRPNWLVILYRLAMVPRCESWFGFRRSASIPHASRCWCFRTIHRTDRMYDRVGQLTVELLAKGQTAKPTWQRAGIASVRLTTWT